MMSETRSSDEATLWRQALSGDRQAFERLVEPYLEELLRAARRDLAYHQALGDLAPEDLTAEELVGETLARAWRDRNRRPPALGVRAWLLGTQHRVLQRLVRNELAFRRLWAVSLEQRVPDEPIYDDDESFWEWYQPDDLERWEDVVPAEEIPVEEQAELGEAVLEWLEPEERQVLLLRDEHRLTLEEIAWIMQRTVGETAEIARAARERARSRTPQGERR